MNVILAIILALSALTAPAPAPVMEPASFTVAPLRLASQWTMEALAEADMAYPENVVFLYQNEDNCGAQRSTVHMGGCTRLKDGRYTVYVSPQLAYTAWGNHILFHELAHTMGANECQAEAYAHQFEYLPLWSYPACKG